MGTLKVGTMTGKWRELVDGEQSERVRWRLQVVLQWCRWERVWIVGLLSKELMYSLTSVSRTNNRVTSVKLGISDTVVNVIGVYAPQVGCEDEEKETFWRQMNQELRAIPEGERVIVRGDVNGHVRISRVAIERIYVGWGVREKTIIISRLKHMIPVRVGRMCHREEPPTYHTITILLPLWVCLSRSLSLFPPLSLCVSLPPSL